jgi:hypothetical protein
VNSASITPRFVRATLGVVTASFLLLSQHQPTQAAKKPKPFNIKGSYSGTYLSQDTTLSGPLKVVISGAKKLTPGATTLFVQGKITLGTKTKNQKCQGFYNPDARYLAINAPVASGYSVSFAGTVGEDNKTITGTFGYTHVPALDEQVIGSATIAKR